MIDNNQPHNSFILHAPNINRGGGLRLLEALISELGEAIHWAQLDTRIQNSVKLPKTLSTHYVNPTVLSRLLSELRLRSISTKTRHVLCFHGLPPLLPNNAHVIIYIQNRLLLGRQSLIGYPVSARLRIYIERIWLRLAHRPSYRYLVQTPSMETLLKEALGKRTQVARIAFTHNNYLAPANTISNGEKLFDFLYVASGDAHKNHRLLLEAWCLLANSNLYPSLALTINATSHPELSAKISKLQIENSLNITNLGSLNPDEIISAYQSSSALIYPSLSESLGLPLIEASHYGLPIISAELDYVRDIVDPVQTFDANSPTSMARAVKRFMNIKEPRQQVSSAKDILRVVGA